MIIMDLLPIDVILEILLKLKYEDIVSSILTCKRLFSFFKDEYFWIKKTEHDFDITREEIKEYLFLRKKITIPNSIEKNVISNSYDSNHNLIYVKFLYLFSNKVVEDSKNIINIDHCVKLAVYQNNMRLVKAFISSNQNQDEKIRLLQLAIEKSCEGNNYQLAKCLTNYYVNIIKRVAIITVYKSQFYSNCRYTISFYGHNNNGMIYPGEKQKYYYVKYPKITQQKNRKLSNSMKINEVNLVKGKHGQKIYESHSPNDQYINFVHIKSISIDSKNSYEECCLDKIKFRNYLRLLKDIYSIYGVNFSQIETNVTFSSEIYILKLENIIKNCFSPQPDKYTFYYTPKDYYSGKLGYKYNNTDIIIYDSYEKYILTKDKNSRKIRKKDIIPKNIRKYVSSYNENTKKKEKTFITKTKVNSIKTFNNKMRRINQPRK